MVSARLKKNVGEWSVPAIKKENVGEWSVPTALPLALPVTYNTKGEYKMNDKLVITVGREYGSGGHEVGRRLAERMGVKCYDKELLELAAKNSGLAEELFDKQDEKPTSSLLYSLVMDTYSFGYSDAYSDMPINQRIFLAQFDTIKKLGEAESCVIVGRCADYALEGYEHLVSAFVTAPLENRIKTIMERESVDAKKAESLIHKTDKKRASYYDYYSDKKWGRAESYDICLNSGVVGIDGVVDLILDFAEKKDSVK